MSGIVNSTGARSGVIGTTVGAGGSTSASDLDSGTLAVERMAAGTIIKTGSIFAFGDFATTSTTWVVQDDITLTFTPLLASSNILLTTSFFARKLTSGDAHYSFYKNASDFTEDYNIAGAPYPASGSYGLATINYAAASVKSSVSYQWLDPMTEDSISEKTYKISLKTSDGETATCGQGTAQSLSITAMEIKT